MMFGVHEPVISLSVRGVVRISLALGALLAMACQGDNAPQDAPTGRSAVEPTLAIPSARELLEAPVAEVQPPAPRPVPATSGLGRLAYIGDGDLWVKDIDSGAEHRLTTTGDVVLPRWSASGDWLLYQRDLPGQVSQAWLIKHDGTLERQLEAEVDKALQWTPDDIAWSPFDDVVAFVSDADSLVIESADGTTGRTLLPPMANAGLPAGRSNLRWSPDGEWIAFREHTGPPRSARIRAVRVDTGDVKELVSLTASQVDCVDLRGWSGDSAFVLFSAQTCSASLRADGLALLSVPLFASDPLLPSGEELAQGPVTLFHGDFVAPAPDSSVIAIADGGGRETWTSKSVSLLDAATGAMKTLTAPDTAAFSPGWSPDRTKLVYVAAPDIGRVGGGEPARLGSNQRRIWVMRGDGGGQTPVTSDDAYRDEYPVWTLDGSQILFARLDSGNQASVWIVNSRGGSPTKIADVSTPVASFAMPWFGYYGHVDWKYLYDFWPGQTAP